MKKTLLFIFSVFIGLNVMAQFSDDMESYTDGEPIIGNHWTDWGCGGGPGCAIMATSEIVHTGNLAGLIPDDGTTDAVLDLGNKIFGHYRLEFWMYVPTGKEAYWNIKGCVPICAEDWGIHFFFNQNNQSPGEGTILDSPLGQIDFTFPHDQWFRIYMDWDIYSGIALATWYLSIDSIDIIPYNTPYTNGSGEIPLSVGGIEFFSMNTGSTKYYLDNFIFCDEIDPPVACTLGGLDFNAQEITIYPNPTEDLLTIQNQNALSVIEVTLYDTLGRKVMERKDVTESIDVSSLTPGIYFLHVTTDRGTVTKKIIKE